MAAPASEATPLLSSANEGATAIKAESSASLFSPFRRLLLAGLLVSISFSFTGTALLYSFRKISCEILYAEGTLPEWDGTGEKCAYGAVESMAARNLSFMITLSTLSSVVSIFTSGYITRRFGIKLAFIAQTFFPCLRNLCQIFGFSLGGRAGLLIVQWTQPIAVLGGAGGFLLCANTYGALLVSPEARTGSFGIIQGTNMMGTSLAYMLGGIVGDTFGLIAPFKTAFCLLTITTLFSTFFLPYLPPTPPPLIVDEGPKRGRIATFFSTLRIFLPRVVDEEAGGTGKTYWGLTLMGLFAFMAVLALNYVPFLIQLLSATFGFRPSDTGILMAGNTLFRSLFLTMLFPRIIARGRKWYSKVATSDSDAAIPTDVTEEQVGERIEPIQSLATTDVGHGAGFDLLYARTSVLVEGTLTAGLLMANQGWNLYLAAVILPLGSGTASAVRGTILEMVRKEDQPDALQAIALVEMLAMVSTVTLSGNVFAFLSGLGLAKYTFAMNALLAYFTAFIGLFVRFPPGHSVSQTRSSTRK